MKLDFATLSFGYRIISGGGTPNWATSLGQGKEHKINNDPKIDEILKGITYCSVNLAKISVKIGKGGRVYHGDELESGVVLGSVFSKVYVNDVLIKDAKFILILAKDLAGVHTGRLKIKYGPSNTYEEGAKKYSNELFFTQVREQLGLSNDACWFVDEINVRNQDELVLKTFIVNSKGIETYDDTVKHHEAWGKFAPISSEPLDENGVNSVENISAPTKHTNPIQKIFYGVPGCGKSHKISEMLEDKNIFDIKSEENQIVRTVFHPDYTKADFVGQILPEVNGSKIEYNFKAGPFTKILAKALVHSENQYVLIIEEINRGNSAVIFGEIFQLLDRLEGEKTSTIGGNKYGKGWSEYFFMNDLINEYVRKMASSSDTIETSVQINGITFTENTGIRLPPNLSLLATMNTSDQNVFTLDNAFQRRWDMEYISNRYNEATANEKQKAQYNSKIGETAISWGKFRDAINKEISNPENSFANAEDKQLGLFFIKAENNVIKESDFSNKVLKYLWNDIFKRDKSIFNDDVSTFGDLLEAFSGADAFTNSFSSDFVSKIAE